VIVEYLKKLPLFEQKMDNLNKESGLSSIINSLAHNIGYKKLNKNDTIIEYGSNGDEFYIIVQGTVTVYVPRMVNSVKTSTAEMIKFFNITAKKKSNDRCTFRTAPEEEEKLHFEYMGELGPGKCFGERAIESGNPRIARIKCNDQCHFAVVSKYDYNHLLKSIKTKTQMQLSEVIRQIPFISHWSLSQLSKVCEYFEKQSFIMNQHMIKEKDPVKYIYLIKSGEYEIIKSYAQNDKEARQREYNEKVLKPLLNLSTYVDLSKGSINRFAKPIKLATAPRIKMFLK
jgi:CRP-like cAMP-binding protein